MASAIIGWLQTKDGKQWSHEGHIRDGIDLLGVGSVKWRTIPTITFSGKLLQFVPGVFAPLLRSLAASIKEVLGEKAEVVAILHHAIGTEEVFPSEPTISKSI